ncbi:MAG TPA: glycine cleavage system aminomethyltransferase GcvT [Limnochorda sp.]
MVAELRNTPLREAHVALGGRLIDFAGWAMPVQYPDGILAETVHVRKEAGLFDLSHMGELWVTGPDAEAFLQSLLTNDLSQLRPGAAQYTLLCNPRGGIVDDLVVYRLEDGFLLVVNAANREKDLAWLEEHRTAGVHIEDRSLATGLIALQGPRAAEILAPLCNPSPEHLAFYHFQRGRVAGHEALISRTGYTGEDGFELYLAWDHTPAVWDALLAREGVKPAGLGARDLLRLEMTYPLYGNDIDEETSPLEAGLGWVVKPQKGDFVGREAILRQKAEGPRRRRVAFVQESGPVPRHGYPLLDAEGRQVGVVTSGGFSPHVNAPIGMGYVEAALAQPGHELAVLARGKTFAARLQRRAFVSARTKRPEAT